jgi:tRNA A37 threonylcarbamoyltransferase TsaD
MWTYTKGGKVFELLRQYLPKRAPEQRSSPSKFAANHNVAAALRDCRRAFWSVALFSGVVNMLIMEGVQRTGVRDIALAGGVSANTSLRRRLKAEAERRGVRVFAPRLEYCMDNGAMIGYVGWMRIARGLTSTFEAPALARLEIAGAAP